MTKKITSLFVALMLVAGVFGATTASAATVAELQAMIAQLQTQLSALGGSSAVTTTTATTFTRDLTVGSTGADVAALQAVLNTEVDAGLPGTTYFGALTKAAVVKFQKANGINATGYVGPLTRAALNSLQTPTVTTTTTTTTTTDTTTTTSTLEGTDGSISDVSLLSQYDDEEVGEGKEDVKVLGVEVEASNDGDIALKSIKIAFDPNGNTGSEDLDDYIDSVAVWQGTTKIGSADVDDFNQDDNDVYTKTITLDSGVVVKADETEKFYVTVTAANNIDSDDMTGDSWTLAVESIRFADGSGVVTTDDSTGDLVSLDGDGTPAGTPVSFVTYSDSTDTELKFSLDTSSPDEGVVTIDDSDTTDNVVLLVGKIKLEGDSDVTIDELPITLAVTGTSSIATMVDGLTLKLGDEEYSENAATTTTFNNLNYTLGAGDTVTFTVLADINGAEEFAEGDSLKASLTSTNRDNIDAENEEGDQLSDSSEKSGTITGKNQSFRTDGISVELSGTPTEEVTKDIDTQSGIVAEQGTFVIKYKVTANGDDMYIDKSVQSMVATPSTAGAGTAWATTTDITSATSTVLSATVSVSGSTDDDTTTDYYIAEGESRTFTLKVLLEPGVDGNQAVQLTGINWTSDASDTTADNYYTFNLDDFKTDSLFLDTTYDD